MPWIRTIPVEAAEGRLADSYRAAVGRVGYVAGILRAMSLAPAVLDAAIALYRCVMFAPTGLARHQRELVAVVVSRANRCHY